MNEIFYNSVVGSYIDELMNEHGVEILIYDYSESPYIIAINVKKYLTNIVRSINEEEAAGLNVEDVKTLIFGIVSNVVSLSEDDYDGSDVDPDEISDSEALDIIVGGVYDEN